MDSTKTTLPISTRSLRAASDPRRGNVGTMREVNDLLVLNCLREHQPIASVEIARILGMEPATVCKVIRRLSESGFIREGSEGKAGPRGGRRPRLLHLESNARLIIGVDMALSVGRGIVVDLLGKVHHRAYEKARGKPEEVVLRIVDSLMSRLGPQERQKLAGVGIGAVDAVHGTGLMSTGKDFVPITEMVTARFDVPAFVDENTNSFAMAEKHFGSGRGASSFLCIWYRGGVGHALMINGRLFRGAHNSFGETRHYLIPGQAENRPDDPSSAVQVRPQAIAQLAARMGREAGPFLSAAVREQGPEEVIAAVAEGVVARDPATMKAIEEVARGMAVSLSYLGELLDPEVLIVGGPVTRWGGPMLELLRRYVGELAKKTIYRAQPPRLEFTQLGDDVIAFGGAAMVMEHVFERVGITAASC